MTFKENQIQENINQAQSLLHKMHPKYCQCGVKITKRGQGINGIDTCEKCFHEATKHMAFK